MRMRNVWPSRLEAAVYLSAWLPTFSSDRLHQNNGSFSIWLTSIALLTSRASAPVLTRKTKVSISTLNRFEMDKTVEEPICAIALGSASRLTKEAASDSDDSPVAKPLSRKKKARRKRGIGELTRG